MMTEVTAEIDAIIAELVKHNRPMSRLAIRNALTVRPRLPHGR